MIENNKTNTVGEWGAELAKIWTNYLPPCRVSWSELSVYTKYLRIIQQRFGLRKIKLLILGSTSEFRDWGHEEQLDVTVIDYSEGYNIEIANQMKYKNASEHFLNCRWQDMDFHHEFHLIVGDLVVGNLKEGELPNFLVRINKSLCNGGLFLTKSFFQDTKYSPEGLDKVFQDYNKAQPDGHPFGNLIYRIAMNCVDKNTHILLFAHMYDEINKIYKNGLISRELFEVFSRLGWQENMKFEFYFPTTEAWEKLTQENFSIVARERSNDVYSSDFVVYVLAAK